MSKRQRSSIAFEMVNASGSAPFLITVEHASNHIPPEFGDLGLSRDVLDAHLAYDLYAAEFGTALAKDLDAPAILGATSRLLVDCNRLESSHQLIRAETHGVSVPGNRDLNSDQVRDRTDRYYRPYHDGVERAIEAYQAKHGHYPYLISVHTFTHTLDGGITERDCDIGLLWDVDKTLAEHLQAHMNTHFPELNVGQNVPYDAHTEEEGALHVFGHPKGISGIEIEINQKSLSDPHKHDAILRAIKSGLRSLNELGVGAHELKNAIGMK
ncbi:MAG: N-formylglutamate amidohydrolase [Pseudomonadota bacterium]